MIKLFAVDWSENGQGYTKFFKQHWEAVEFARDLYRDFLIPSDLRECD
jgi:sulfur relay (sulfurtransferase) DsrC/TusE family protein